MQSAGALAPAPRVHGLPPLWTDRARVLVVGSMPGAASLRAQQYYAHPQNAFWPILGACCGFDPMLPYCERVAHLLRAGIAVWDVLQSCRRQGSLDAAIDARSEVANDFAARFAAAPRLAAVLCNGGKAFVAFHRHVLPTLGPQAERLQVQRLPSTSPAHAGRSRAAKAAAWHAALAPWVPERAVGGRGGLSAVRATEAVQRADEPAP